MSNTHPIVLLHGLGARPITLKGIEWYLWWQGYSNIHNVAYPADTQSFEDCLSAIDQSLKSLFGKARTQHIVVIGQSMGGVFGAYLHHLGWTLDLLITIGSPLHGASILNYAAKRLPMCLSDALMKPNYEFLMCEKQTIAPPHRCHCITMSWPLIDFDGCVFVDEARFESHQHTHLAWADHRSVFANPRLWSTVHWALIKE